MVRGRQICEATLLKLVRRMHETLTGWEHAAIERLLEMSVLHADETSIRVTRKNHWTHSCSFADIVIKMRHPKRGAVQQQPSRARLLNGKRQTEGLRNLLKLRSCPSLQSMSCQGFCSLDAVQIALDGNAAQMLG